MLPSSPFSQRGIVTDVMLSAILKKMTTTILLASKDILKFEIKLKAPKKPKHFYKDSSVTFQKQKPLAKTESKDGVCGSHVQSCFL